MQLSLGTPNQAEAATRARDQYLFLRANGWQAFFERFRPRDPTLEPSKLTVGEFLGAVRNESDLKAKTIDGYEKRFRQIVAAIAGIEPPEARRQDSQAWRQQVYSVPLASITPTKVRAWRKRYIDEAGRNEIRRRHQVVSANSLVKNARALFSQRKVLAELSNRTSRPSSI